MSNECIFISDVGTSIILDTQSDISTALIYRMYYEDPNGDTGYFTCILEGTEQIKYSTTGVDLNIAGDWVIQAYVEYAGGNKFYGCKIILSVKSNIITT